MEPCEVRSAMVLIRLDQNYSQEFRNAINKHMSVIQNSNGRCLGMTDSDEVHCLESGIGWWNGKQAVALFEFDTLHDAELWCCSMPELRQQDFLHKIDIVILPARLSPSPDKRCVLMLDAHIYNEDSFFDGYAARAVAALRDCANVNVGCVATTDGVSVRSKDGWSPGYTVLHFFSSRAAYESYVQSQTFCDLCNLRSSAARCDEVMFELKEIKPMLYPD